ncbi:MAG: penicillin-binding protein activator LpoB [Treponema sp.]|jgi:hypothetical protein|nr:penicillin-binding protein activator LpoB [Treponema sp.]
MKKNLLVLAYTCIISPLFAQTVSLDTAINDYAQLLVSQIPKDKALAIIGFETTKPQLMEYFFDTMLEKIWEHGARRIYERQRMENLQKELEFSLTEYVDEKTAQRIGHFVGAGIVIYGSISSIGSDYRISIRAGDVETGQVLVPKSYDLKADKRLTGLLGLSAIKPQAPKPSVEYRTYPVLGLFFSMFTNGGNKSGFEFETLDLQAGIYTEALTGLYVLADIGGGWGFNSNYDMFVVYHFGGVVEKRFFDDFFILGVGGGMVGWTSESESSPLYPFMRGSFGINLAQRSIWDDLSVQTKVYFDYDFDDGYRLGFLVGLSGYFD